MRNREPISPFCIGGCGKLSPPRWAGILTFTCRKCRNRMEREWRDRHRARRMEAARKRKIAMQFKRVLMGPCIDTRPNLLKSAWRYFSHAELAKAIRNGTIPKAKESGLACADCGKRALCWDHRDYGRPLDVVAVCYACNISRGTAVYPSFLPPKYRKYRHATHAD